MFITAVDITFTVYNCIL